MVTQEEIKELREHEAELQDAKNAAREFEEEIQSITDRINKKNQKLDKLALSGRPPDRLDSEARRLLDQIDKLEKEFDDARQALETEQNEINDINRQINQLTGRSLSPDQTAMEKTEARLLGLPATKATSGEDALQKLQRERVVEIRVVEKQRRIVEKSEQLWRDQLSELGIMEQNLEDLEDEIGDLKN